jgi:hypothetical protein
MKRLRSKERSWNDYLGDLEAWPKKEKTCDFMESQKEFEANHFAGEGTFQELVAILSRKDRNTSEIQRNGHKIAYKDYKS